MEDDEDAELSVVEYARLHGLARDHLAEPYPLDDIETLQRSLPDGLTDDGHRPQTEPPPPFEWNERLTLDKDAAKYLADANNIVSATQEINAILTSLLDVRTVRNLRVERPLLRTNHDADCKAFRKRREPRIDSIKLPMEILDDEKDEGLGWPTAMQALPGQLINKMQAAKIEISQDVLLYLQNILKDSWSQDDEQELWENESTYKKNTAREPVTPPLLPMSPSPVVYIPSSPDCYLPLTSDPPSLIDEDLQALEKEIFKTEKFASQVGTHSSTSSDTVDHEVHSPSINMSSPSAYMDSDLSCSLTKRNKVQDLKVEAPLLPMSPVTTTKKIVTFDLNIEEMLLDSMWKDDGRTSSLAASSSAPTDDPMETAFVEEAFGPSADMVMRKIEQEQLLEADSTKRVKVPIMDFTTGDPPWKQTQQVSTMVGVMATQNAMIREVSKAEDAVPTWLGIRNLNTKLSWVPFPHEYAKVIMEEDIEFDHELQHFLIATRDDEVIASSALTWKPPGLRILKEDDDIDDYIEPADFQDSATDVLSLVKKRKIQLDEDAVARSNSATSFHDSLTMNQKSNPHHEPPKRKLSQAPKKETQVSNIGRISTAEYDAGGYHISRPSPLLHGGSALDAFLMMQGSKKQKLMDSTYFPNTSAAREKATIVSKAHVEQVTPISSQAPIPSPCFNPPDSPTPVIISLPLMKRRVLVSTLTALFPCLILIERDFTAHNTVAWQSGSVSRSPIISPLADEADIIISPSTGIILTTLQKIKQKALPGQKAKVEIRARIEKVSVRYERLIVLITECTTEDRTRGLNHSDAIALSAFTGFCASLETHTIVHFIAGGEPTLGKWLASTIIRYGIREALLSDETIWELFLRRVGLNAFAAQAVLAVLKAPEGVDAASPSKAGFFGVTGFVDLDAGERVRRFEALMDGRKVLTRVGKVLDRHWGKAYP